ncbi:MAG: GDSL-type esterase/lipase family protein [Vicinamibacteraceae bacterium]
MDGDLGNSADPSKPVGHRPLSLSGFDNESIRMIVQTSIGGELVRIRLSNAHGTNDVTIGHATVARPRRPSVPDLAPSSVEELSFGGSPSVTVPVGSEMVSDPIRMFVPPLSQLAVTIYLPHATGPTSWHWFAKQTAFVYDGDHASEPNGGGYSSTVESFYFLAGVEVQTRTRVDGAVAVYGASISDGFGSTVNTNHRWPDFLARRILRDERHLDLRLGVLNVSLSGNATTHDGDERSLPEVGINGLDRLSQDVDTQPGVRTVIVDLGLNDIFRHDDPPERIIGGLQQIAAAVHQRGLRVLVATLSPAAGSGESWTPEREATRQAVNAYIRSTSDTDGVVDIDLAIRDPADPTRLNPRFYSTDQVHPNDLGNRAIAEVVPLGRL